MYKEVDEARASRSPFFLFAIALILAFQLPAARAQESGHTWQSSVTSGTYDSQAGVEAAIRQVQGYETSTSVKSATASETAIKYYYDKGSFDSIKTAVFGGVTGTFSTEAEAASDLAAYQARNAQDKTCGGASATPDGDWYPEDAPSAVRSYRVEYYDKPAGSATCVKFTNYSYVTRGQNESCPAAMTLSYGQCTDNATVPVVVVTSKPVFCSTCSATGGPDKVGDPIDIAFGELVESEIDADVGGFRIERFYHSSLSSPFVGFRHGWSLSLLMRLTFESQSQPTLLRGDGTQVIFKNLGLSYEAMNGSGDRLSSGTNEWTLRTSKFNATFDAGGLLNKIEYRDGRVLRYAYEKYGRVATITDALGRVLAFQYGVGPQGVDVPIASITLSGVPIVSYTYKATGQLESAVYPGSAVARIYRYDDSRFPNHLTSISDESGGSYANFSYDAQGRAVSASRAGGADGGSVVYNSQGGVTFTDSLGHSSRHDLTPELGDGRIRKAGSTVDSQGSVSRTYNDVASDFRRRINTIVDKNGTKTTFLYSQAIEEGSGIASNYMSTHVAVGTAIERTTETYVDTSNNALILQRDAGKSETRFARNARQQIIGISIKDLATSEVRNTAIAYCEPADLSVSNSTCPIVGLTKSIDGPRIDVSDVTLYSYYPSTDPSCTTSSCAYRKGDLWKVSDALGHVTEILSYDLTGRPLSMKDANGIVTDLEYSPRGWLTASKVRGADNAVETDDVITRMDYFPTGLVQTVTQPDGTFTTFEYDAAHRLTAIANNLGDRIAYTLDNAGNRTQEDTRDASGTLRRTLSRVYNQLGQLTAAKDAYGVATSMTYDASGNTDLATDAKARSTDNDYDPLDRLTRTLQDTAGIKAETKFGYDAQDNLTAVVDPKGLTTGYTYSGLGDLTRLTSPDTGVTDYTYDSAGNLKTKQDARGASAKATYSYDALNRLTGISYATTSPNLNVTYAYDTSNTVCAAGETFAIGRMSRMTDGSGSTQYCYDRFGRMVRKVQTTNAKVFTTTYQFAVSGRLLAMTYPSGLKVDYGFDAAGRPNSVKATRPGQAQETLVGNVTYYPFGPVGSLTFAGGRVVTRQFDKNYRPTLVQDATGIGLHDLLGWDAVGNLTSLANSATTPLSTPLANYKYDTLNRLTGRYAPSDTSQTNPLQGYAYDATGNRLSDTKVTSATATTAYTYPATSHRLTKVGTVARTYDAMGNMLTGTVGGVAKTYTFDVTGRMNVAKNGSTVQMNYAYNGKGEQVRRYPTATSTAQTYETYDEAGHWLGEYDSTGTRKQEFIWLGDLPVGVYANSPGSTTNFQLYEVQADHLGTPRVVIDPARSKAVWTWPLTGEAFGTTAPSQDPDADGKAFALDMRFPGQRYDSGSNLNYNYFREYESGTGRYAESDLVGLAGGISTYAYVKAAPFARTDVLGLSPGAPAIPVSPYGSSGFSWLEGAGAWLSDAAAGLASRAAFGTGAALLLYTPDMGYSDCEASGVDFAACIARKYPRPAPLYMPKQDASCPADDEEKKRQNCQALKSSILNTCAGLTGRKKFACFAAAEESYRQCMGW